MHARIVTCQVRADKLNELIQIYRDSIVPAAQQQPGFKGSTLFTDRAANKCISVTIWETETQLTVGETNGYYLQQIAKLVPILSAVPIRETYEVSIQR